MVISEFIVLRTSRSVHVFVLSRAENPAMKTRNYLTDAEKNTGATD